MEAASFLRSSPKEELAASKAVTMAKQTMRRGCRVMGEGERRGSGGLPGRAGEVLQFLSSGGEDGKRLIRGGNVPEFIKAFGACLFLLRTWGLRCFLEMPKPVYELAPQGRDGSHDRESEPLPRSKWPGKSRFSSSIAIFLAVIAPNRR